MKCRSCGTELTSNTEHRFEATIDGQTQKYSLCELCCPNCFGGVGGNRQNPKKPDNGVMFIP